MKHILQQDRDTTMGAVDVYLDVGVHDLEFNEAQQSFIKNAVASKAQVCAVRRQFGGTTLFTVSNEPGSEQELAIIKAMISTLGRPAPVEVRSVSTTAWGKK
jgi:hypothetical protein